MTHRLAARLSVLVLLATAFGCSGNRVELGAARPTPDAPDEAGDAPGADTATDTATDASPDATVDDTPTDANDAG